MDTTRAEQIALDDALVAPANRLKIGKSNLRLSSDLKSKEATLQVVYDVLKLTPFYKAFQITTDVPEIYMQEQMLQICPKLPDQQFQELPFEEEILTFLRDLGHSGEIKVITDANVNKLYQPWRSFAADFVYQVEKKNVKRSNEMYYPRFTKVLINFFMTKDQSILRRNKVNWHFARDDPMCTTIKVISRHEDTQLYGAILPIDLKNEAIKDSESYKEFYAIASGVEPSKTKASAKKKQVESDKAKDLRQLLSGSGADEGTSVIPGVPDVPKYGSDDEQISWKSSNDDEQTDSDNDGDDFVHPKFSTHDEEDKEEDSFNPRVQTPSHVESTDDEDSDEEIQDANVEGDKMNEEETNEEAEVDALYRDVNVNLEGIDTEMTDAPCTIVKTTQVIEDTHVIITPVNPEGQQHSSSVSSSFVSNMLNPSPDIGIDSLFNLNTELTSLVDVLVTTIAEPPLLSVTTLPPPPTPLITHLQQTPVPTPPTVPSSSLQDLPNFGSPALLMPEALTRPSNESKTSYSVAANISELELKKILIDKMESNKSIHISDEQKNLYKALVDSYESDKLILDTYRETVSFKRCRDEEDKDEKPFAGSNRGSKRRRARKEPESTSAPKEKTSKTTGKSTEGSKSHHKSANESAQAEDLMQTAKDLEEFAHQEFKTGVTKDQPDKETSQLPDWFQKPAKPPTPDRDWNKTLPDAHGPGISHWGRKRQQFYGFAVNRESARDVYSKHRIIAVTKLEIVEWHNYKHLDWITVRRYDDKLHKFKEGDFKRLCIQDIEDMLLLLVQGKLTNLTVKERIAFNNKDKKNKLMRIDELHKFSDGTLNDVRTALNDRLKGIRMKYLPQTIWRQSDRDKAAAMIQAIDKQLKTMRIMQSLKKFVGGRPYEDKMDSMHFTLSMYYDYDAHVKGELLVMMKNSQSVNLLIFISNTLIELFNDFGFDCDGIPERPTMYLNLWSYKVVRYRYSNPMIQPEPRIYQGYSLGMGKKSLEHAEFDESDTHVLERFDTSAGNPVKEILLKLNLPDHRILKDGGEVKEFQRSFRHSDTERLSRSDEVLKLKNFKKDATLKLFKSTNQERYEHVGPEVTRSHGGKIYKMAKRDYAWLMISRCSRSHSRQAKEQAQDLKSMITTSNHKIND
ncbi:hypothetical protein Tco_1402388 [Tanacetum coccineum]